MDYKEERVFDFVDLFYRIFRKWRTILVCVLIGAVLFGLFGYIRSAKVVDTGGDSGSALNASIISGMNRLKKAEKSLSEREIKETQIALDAYLSYRKLYENTRRYGDNSLLQKLDAQRVPTLTNTYLISNYAESTEPVLTDNSSAADNIIGLFRNELVEGDIVSEIRNNADWYTAENYIREVVSVQKIGKSIMQVSVFGQDQAQCEAVMEALEQRLSNVTPKLQAAVAFDIQFIGTYYSVKYDETLSKKQQTFADTISSQEKNMLALADKLTDAQKEYYKAWMDLGEYFLQQDPTLTYLGVSNKANEAYDEAVAEMEKLEAQPVKVVRTFSLKYLILGIFFGLFIPVMWIFVRYAVSPRLKTAEEMTQLFHTYVLGEMSAAGSRKRRKNAVDRLIDRIFHKETPVDYEEMLGMICSGIQHSASRKNCGRIFVTGSGMDKASVKLKERICERLAEQGGADLTVAAGDCVMHDPASLRRLAESDGVVLVEGIDASRYADIEREIEICRKYETNILGSVVMN